MTSSGAGVVGVSSTGAVVAKHLGLSWSIFSDPFGLGIDVLAGLAVRQNPLRAHLVVSRVLGKHVPAPPATALRMGRLLAELVQHVLDPARLDSAGEPFAASVLVLGYCETATALGHSVADAFPRADYVHTTRRPDPSRPSGPGFLEEHSHAARHDLQPPPGWLADRRPLVLVDDELTTGTTALNTISVLHECNPRDRYVVASLMDLRSARSRELFDAQVAALGVRVDVVALLDGELHLPSDVLTRGAVLQRELRQRNIATDAVRADVVRHPRIWPQAVPTGGRFGFSFQDREAFDAAITLVGSSVSRALAPGSGAAVLVLGTEELMYAPVRLAAWLADALPAVDVVVQATTRSPVLPMPDPGYAVRHKLTFPSPDDHGRSSFLYNVDAPAWTSAAAQRYTDIVVVADDAPGACSPLLEALRPWADHAVHLVPVGAEA